MIRLARTIARRGAGLSRSCKVFGLAGVSAGIALLLATPGLAIAQPAYRVTESREACTAHDPLRQPFFGDTHVHTAYSFDASTQDTRNTPRDAYRFARGGVLGIQPYDGEGNSLRSVKLARALDFTVVTDHAELLGETHLCLTPGSSEYGALICKIHRWLPNLAMQLISGRTLVWKTRWGICGDEGFACMNAERGVWTSIQEAAEEAYDRTSSCSFTSFVGYEWTATVGTGKNLHRNVVFRNAKVPPLPVSWVETPSASHLWDVLEDKCLRGIPGCDVLTIPHNSNLSGGLIFESARLESEDDRGEPIDSEDARRRARFEPLVEIMQHKGDSECSAEWGAADEMCGFEALPYDAFGAKFSVFVKAAKPAPSNFVRDALKQGLKQQAELGANSLKFGIIASTDTHIATPGLTEERIHPGHGGAGLSGDEIRPVGFQDNLEFGPGGLAVVWAEENSRDALFAAMTRREVYGTSGTRPIVRLFGGWDYPDDICSQPNLVAQGYAGGVPMGGDLDSSSAAKRGDPQFVFSAMRDPGTSQTPGTKLQRIQIVKGWFDGAALRETVIDVAGAKNDASVDLATCEAKGAGHDSLCARWVDSDFAPEQQAFYYGRVLENPTCRWSQYVCNAAEIDCTDPGNVPRSLEGCCSPEHQPVIQERAWTSPIWYSPSSR